MERIRVKQLEGGERFIIHMQYHHKEYDETNKHTEYLITFISRQIYLGTVRVSRLNPIYL
jgi:hypothetical protein